MARYPILIERPILILATKAAVGRPTENIQSLLDEMDWARAFAALVLVDRCDKSARFESEKNTGEPRHEYLEPLDRQQGFVDDGWIVAGGHPGLWPQPRAG